MKKYNLLFFVHWIHMLIVICYPWMCSNPSWDRAYLLYVGLAWVHWMFFSGECVVSVEEKKKIVSDYHAGECPTLHPFLLTFGKCNTRLLAVVLDVLVFLSMTRVISRSWPLQTRAYALAVVMIIQGKLYISHAREKYCDSKKLSESCAKICESYH